ncbi:MAG TPA: selenide, water dikinase SelD [Saprospirales bacterium]|nr:selenide, water dikinase SelD [Saprospirales bacterium]
MIYLDYNASTPLDKAVIEAMKPVLEMSYGNPSSMHKVGMEAKMLVEKARMQVAGLIHCDPSEIIFTSGGTESNNFAIKGAAFAHKEKGNHIITSAIEHPAVMEVCHYLEKNGFLLTVVEADEYGLIDPAKIEAAIRPETILISVMHANNEIGTIQDIAAIAKIAHEHQILMHCDAAQSAGKIATDIKNLGVDLMSIAGHKLYAPKGVGALYIKSGTRLEKLMHGANHEQNLRAGTENVLEIVGFGKACELAGKGLEHFGKHTLSLREKLYEGLKNALPEIKRNGHIEKSLPNTLSISFPGIEANTLVSRLEHIAVSAGAACHAEHIDVSDVLKALKIPVQYAMGTIRFSLGKFTTEEEINQAIEQIIPVVNSLKNPDKILETTHEAIRLTQFTHGLGCACKIQPQVLESILKKLPKASHPDILVGVETSDDATVYRINDEQAVVQTLDFFTPVVDDAYDFGAIAAANALSDIYAMGAVPLFAQNIVAFPQYTLPMSVLEDILKGAADKVAEAGISILGGHTIEDNEPKFGLVVTGLVHPVKLLKNIGAKPGDGLIITKALGTGILSTAMKRGILNNHTKDKLVRQMSALNNKAAQVISHYKISACTDVTGFGLLGHLLEMSKGSGCDVELDFSNIPLMDDALNFATAGIYPGGSVSNLEHVRSYVDFGQLNHPRMLILADAQTSGGLLIAVDPNDENEVLNGLNAAGLADAWLIGRFTSLGTGQISVK